MNDSPEIATDRGSARQLLLGEPGREIRHSSGSASGVRGDRIK